jgi:predicted NAD/FAD-binding protein
MTFIDGNKSSALQKKNRAVQEYLRVQKFQSKFDENHFVPHCICAPGIYGRLFP